MEIHSETLIDLAKLTDWLNANIPELGTGQLACEVVHRGKSSITISLDRGGPPMLLRRSPAAPSPNAEWGVLREAQVLMALNGTDVPHPVCYGLCEDGGVIGGCFFVMEKVDGWTPALLHDKIQNAPPFDRMPYSYGLPFAIVEGLVRLANVDHEAIGLERFGMQSNFFEIQIDRWTRQIASYKQRFKYQGRQIVGYNEVEAWLRDNVPPLEVRGIIHGDVGMPNMIFKPAPPARLAAMVNWELSTIGDPMIDLGWFANGLRDERFPNLTPMSMHNNLDQLPSSQELARHYCAGTGRSLEDFDYCTILAGFKIGCLLEYKVAQAAADILPKKVGTFFIKQVDACFQRNAELVQRLS